VKSQTLLEIQKESISERNLKTHKSSYQINRFLKELRSTLSQSAIHSTQHKPSLDVAKYCRKTMSALSPSLTSRLTHLSNQAYKPGLECEGSYIKITQATVIFFIPSSKENIGSSSTTLTNLSNSADLSSCVVLGTYQSSDIFFITPTP